VIGNDGGGGKGMVRSLGDRIWSTGVGSASG